MKEKEEYKTIEEWQAQARSLFGDDPMKWRFICPSCKSVMSVQDYKDAGAPRDAAAFSCVGRWAGAKRQMLEKGKGFCNYAGGGLIRINPTKIGDSRFAFAFDRS